MNLQVLQQDFSGKVLSLSEQVAWCWQNWQPPLGLVLIVLDDVTSSEDCGEFLPKANRFRVLMTRRSRNLDPNIEEISLHVLSPSEALEFLTKLVGQKRVQKELEVANQLCEWLGYLPLGLELVGRYVAKKLPNYKLAQMLQQLKGQRLHNVALNPKQQELQKTLSTAQQGLYAIAEPWCKQCVLVVQSRLAEEHPSVATNYNNLAALYRSQGRYSEAESLIQHRCQGDRLLPLFDIQLHDKSEGWQLAKET